MPDISTFEQNQLYKQSQLKSLQNNTYLINPNNDNFIYIKSKFFEKEDEDRVKLLNVGSGLFSSISDTISFYVGKPTIDIEIDIKKYVEDYVALGFATIGLIRENGELSTEYQPAQNYRNDDGTDNILRLYSQENENTVDLYMLVTTYTIGFIENTLYRLQGSTFKVDAEVDLDTLPQTRDLKPVIETGLDISALIIVKEDELDQFPISLIEKIKQLVYGIDRQIVMQHVQFLQNVDSFVLFKGINWPEKLLKDYSSGKKIDFSSIGKIVNGDEDSSIEFINNVNDLIDTSMKENENNVRRVSAMTDVPIEFLGLDSNDGAIGENSRTLKQGSFIKRIEGIRLLFDKYLKIILKIAKSEEDYTWPDVLAKSGNEIVEELKEAREIRLISHFEAVKIYNNFDDDQAEEEIDKIQEEEEKALLLKQQEDGDSEGGQDGPDEDDQEDS